jgi:hypothetical protein
MKYWLSNLEECQDMDQTVGSPTPAQTGQINGNITDRAVGVIESDGLACVHEFNPSSHHIH